MTAWCLRYLSNICLPLLLVVFTTTLSAAREARIDYPLHLFIKTCDILDAGSTSLLYSFNFTFPWGSGLTTADNGYNSIAATAIDTTYWMYNGLIYLNPDTFTENILGHVSANHEGTDALCVEWMSVNGHLVTGTPIALDGDCSSTPISGFSGYTTCQNPWDGGNFNLTAPRFARTFTFISCTLAGSTSAATFELEFPHYDMRLMMEQIPADGQNFTQTVYFPDNSTEPQDMVIRLNGGTDGWCVEDILDDNGDSITGGFWVDACTDAASQYQPYPCTSEKTIPFPVEGPRIEYPLHLFIKTCDKLDAGSTSLLYSFNFTFPWGSGLTMAENGYNSIAATTRDTTYWMYDGLIYLNPDTFTENILAHVSANHEGTDRLCVEWMSVNGHLVTGTPMALDGDCSSTPSSAFSGYTTCQNPWDGGNFNLTAPRFARTFTFITCSTEFSVESTSTDTIELEFPRYNMRLMVEEVPGNGQSYTQTVYFPDDSTEPQDMVIRSTALDAWCVEDILDDNGDSITGGFWVDIACTDVASQYQPYPCTSEKTIPFPVEEPRIDYPLHVFVKTCDILDAGSASLLVSFNFTFPWGSGLTTADNGYNLIAAIDRDTTYWMYNGLIYLNPDTFTENILGHVSVRNDDVDGFCVEWMSVNGHLVTGTPMALDGECSSTPISWFSGYTTCQNPWDGGNFNLTAPRFARTFTFITCSSEISVDSDSPDTFELEFPRYNMRLMVEEVPGNGQSYTQTVYFPNEATDPQEMVIRAQSIDKWCVDDILDDHGYSITSGFWLDTDCANSDSAYPCTSVKTIPFELAPFPTSMPSSQPSSQPTTVPTSQPSIAPLLSQLGESYKVSNAYGFSALTSGGGVVTWGTLSRRDAPTPTPGMNSTLATTVLATGADRIVANRYAFAALTTIEYGPTVTTNITAWGIESTYVGASGYTAYPGNITSLVANEGAFAAVGKDGAVITFGSTTNGGNISDPAYNSGYSAALASGVVEITASSGAFAARKEDGSVYSWGNAFTGAGVSSLNRPGLANVTAIVGARTAFAAITSEGRVLTFGDKYGGGDSSMVASQLQSDVFHVIAAQSVFVAFKGGRVDNSIVVWGNAYYGGDASSVASQLTAGVVSVAYTAAAFAARKVDGSVVVWGKAAYGGDASVVQAQLTADVVAVHSTHYAFAALKSNGSVVVWGDAQNGGYISAAATRSKLNSGVTAIYSNLRAFAALKTTGEVVLWGSAYHGGDADTTTKSLLAGGVVNICSNDAAFTAIKEDGSAVVWGHPSSIPFTGLLTGVPNLSNATCA